MSVKIKDIITMVEGEERLVRAELIPNRIGVRYINWDIADKKIAVYQRKADGSRLPWNTVVVNALSPGETIITVSYFDSMTKKEFTDACKIVILSRFNYKIIYNGNGDGVTNVPASHESTISVSSMVPKREGFIFLGWARGSTAINPVHFAGDLVSTAGSDGDVTLFAVWKKDLPERLISPDPSVFWCQTGGWFGPFNNGFMECARTAIATTASINTGFIVKPPDVIIAEGQTNKVTINGIEYIRGNYGANYSYNDFKENGTRHGFNGYNFSNDDEIIEFINYELNHGRAVVVRTNGASEHWVTVTGSKTGDPVIQFSDLMGVDPWFNGLNPNNPDGRGSGNDSNNPGKSGIIEIYGALSTQTDFHFEPRAFTINLD